MSEKTRQVPQFSDAAYAHALAIKSTHEYKKFLKKGESLTKPSQASSFFTSLVFSDITL